MIFAIVILFIFVVLLGLLFYFLEKRQQALLSVVAKLREDLKLVQENCLTLRQNDEILAKDLKMILNEFKGVEKKVKRNS